MTEIPSQTPSSLRRQGSSLGANPFTRHPGEGRGWAYQLNQSPIPAFAGMTSWFDGESRMTARFSRAFDSEVRH